MLVYLLFVLAVSASTAAWAHRSDSRIQKAQRMGCAEDNILRRAYNERAHAIWAFAIEQSVEATGETASSYMRLARAFKDIPLKNCR